MNTSKAISGRERGTNAKNQISRWGRYPGVF